MLVSRQINIHLCYKTPLDQTTFDNAVLSSLPFAVFHITKMTSVFHISIDVSYLYQLQRQQ